MAFVRCAGTCDVQKPKCNYVGIESCEAAITLTDNVAHIDYDKCVGCGKCAEKCPSKIIRIR